MDPTTKKAQDMKAELTAALRDRAADGSLTCVEAFRVAAGLSASPLEVGNVATEMGIRLVNCQLGLFRDEDGQRPVTAAEQVAPELEQAMREGLVLERLPCAVAWSLASRFGIKRMEVANAAEKLGLRISQCQLGAF